MFGKADVITNVKCYPVSYVDSASGAWCEGTNVLYHRDGRPNSARIASRNVSPPEAMHFLQSMIKKAATTMQVTS